MRKIHIDIYNRDILIHSGNYLTDRTPESVIKYFTHGDGEMVLEGREIDSHLINREEQLITLRLLVDAIVEIQDFAGQLKELFEKINDEDFNFSLDSDLVLIELPEYLTEEEKQDLYRIFQKEVSDSKYVMVERTYRYEFGASDYFEKFLASVSATYAVRLLDKLYEYFKYSPEKKALIKTITITDKVKQYIADNSNIHKNSLVLTNFVTEDDEYVVTFQSRHKTFMVHLAYDQEIVEIVITKK
jgi:hypothetical protein